MKINVLLTFDYELPLGGIKKSYSHSLFSPAERLLDDVKTLGVPIVLFADILSYIKFEEWGEKTFCDPFKEQIQRALSDGHDVQLHIHPHWLTSSFTDGQFIPSDDFELAGFANENHSDNIEEIVENSINQLSDICSEFNQQYKCVAFRAGGYNLNQETSRIIRALFDAGIRFDSSVSRGYYFSSDISMVDYRKVPDLPNWLLPFDGDLSNRGKSDGILEVPIASKSKSFFELPTRFKLKKYAYRAVENRGRMIHVAHKTGLPQKLQQLLASRMLTVDNHTYSVEYMLSILDYHIRRYKDHNEIYLSLIGHPKSMGDYSFELLKRFVELSREEYRDMINFCTFRELYQKGIHKQYGKNN